MKKILCKPLLVFGLCLLVTFVCAGLAVRVTEDASPEKTP
jgi:hypothetical protein